MSNCMTCKSALPDGMCLAKGKVTVLDAPSCGQYAPVMEVELRQVRAENTKLRKLADGYTQIANYFCDKYNTCGDPYSHCKYDAGGSRQCLLGKLNKQIYEEFGIGEEWER